ncbi:hypothetical protein CRG98_024460 [Punica granatum]|uniref:Uncharacterized protein n=1 Tax=Punica granatum TaxID=22663 RepID=A0A2I0JFX6_PUNGR|nr:hypothetical protein CRG98_024460 [Punica granatum]
MAAQARSVVKGGGMICVVLWCQGRAIQVQSDAKAYKGHMKAFINYLRLMLITLLFSSSRAGLAFDPPFLINIREARELIDRSSIQFLLPLNSPGGVRSFTLALVLGEGGISL